MGNLSKILQSRFNHKLQVVDMRDAADKAKMTSEEMQKGYAVFEKVAAAMMSFDFDKIMLQENLFFTFTFFKDIFISVFYKLYSLSLFNYGLVLLPSKNFGRVF